MEFRKPNRKVDRVFLHCSASDNANHDNVATMRAWHVDPPPKGRGWSDVGYHIFVRKSGQVEMGRSLERTPAAQSGHNTGTIAICLHGLNEAKFTQAQYSVLKDICIQINNAYDGAVTFHGHREVAAKACPVYLYKDILALDSYGRLGLTGASAQPLVDAPTDIAAPVMPTVRRGDRGSAVAQLQRMLMIKDDGILGPKTDSAGRAFQSAHGLVRDGIAGQKTWAALFGNDRIEHIGD